MLKGSCLCGRVRFTLDVDADSPKLKPHPCHCRVCRKITGATTSLNLGLPSSDFKLHSGQLKTVTLKHIDDDFEYSLTFCEDCGSPIYAEAPFREGVVLIQAGCLDEEAVLQIVPEVELNVRCRLGWVKEVEGAEQRQGYTA